MTDIAPAKKKRRRRNRRRGSGGSAGPAPVSQQQTAVQADPYDDASHIAGIKAEQAKHEQRMQSADELATLLIPLIMQPRHKAVFDWLCRASGGTAAAVITSIVRAEVARQTPAWREANGGGGTTSRNLEALAERIPVRR